MDTSNITAHPAATSRGEPTISQLGESVHLLALRAQTLTRATKKALDDVDRWEDRAIAVDAFNLVELIGETARELARIGNQIEARS